MRTVLALCTALLASLGAAQPFITTTDPTDLPIVDERQWFAISGGNFELGAVVTVHHGSTDYEIPDDRTEFVSADRIRVLAGVFPADSTWSVTVTNPNGAMSAAYQIQFASAQGDAGTTPDNHAQVATVPADAPYSQLVPDTPRRSMFASGYASALPAATSAASIHRTEPALITPSQEPQWVTLVGGGFAEGSQVQFGYDFSNASAGHEWSPELIDTVFVDNSRLMFQVKITPEIQRGRAIRVVSPSGVASSAYTPWLHVGRDHLLPAALLAEDPCCYTQNSITGDALAAHALMTTIGIDYVQYDCHASSGVVANLPSARVWLDDVSYHSYSNEPRTEEYSIRMTYCFAFESGSADVLRKVDTALDRIGGEAFREPRAGSGMNWTPWPDSQIPVLYKDLRGAMVEYAPESKSLFVSFSGFAWYHLR